jgi:hypothetical protein
MDQQSNRNEERFDLIIEDLKLLTEKQIEILRGFIVQCVNKNLLDEVRNILKDNREF